MSTRHKNQLLALAAAFFLAIAAFFYFTRLPLQKPLQVGLFSDSYWQVQNGNSYKLLDDAIALFEKEQGFEVEYESGVLKEDYSNWLASKIMQEDVPDVLFILPEDFNDFASLGVFEPLDSYISQEPGGFEEGFYASALDCGRYEESQRALPFECAPKLMFVNKSILEKEGLEMPRDDWNWSDFLDYCKSVTKDKDGDGAIDQYGVVGYEWSDAMESNDISFFEADGKVSLNKPEVKEALLFLEKLQKLESTNESKEFDLGHVLFEPMLFSAFRAYQPYPLSIKKYSNFDWGCMPMPKGPQGENVSSLDCLLVAISSRSLQKDQAWQFVKTLCAREIQSEIFDYSEGVSVLRSVTENNEILADLMRSSNSLDTNVLSKALEQAVIPPRFRDYARVQEEIGLALGQILSESTSIEKDLIIQNRLLNERLEQEFGNY